VFYIATVIIRRGKFYIPTFERWGAIHYSATNPVLVGELDSSAIIAIITDLQRSGHVEHPWPEEGMKNQPRGPIFKAAGVRGAKQLGDGGAEYNILYEKEQIRLLMYHILDPAKRARSLKEMRELIFPLDTPIASIVEAIMQDAAEHPELLRDVA